ncbi:hypothetical protein [Pseudobutyrivibrio xylanivorans]|uniref:N-acetyltransferase n=1 Tax=Pseudobutyrivibrio xylanivorans TaxID=185007 RepID=A0A5P6VNI8_PSEXY|nr:hypothetical protein [Pseudobutyrivibrio xylanivorans]QFJ53928.1 hypothetical protein FXF36_03125 [Pseudobutyrivibrio xylanivorans]
MNNFEWKSIREVPLEVIKNFDCGDYEFNIFLQEKSFNWMDNGYAATYVAVDSEENAENHITKIYAYASINCTGLLYKAEHAKYLSCVEIRMFAVSRRLRGDGVTDVDGIRYSYKVFQSLMQELYYMSTNSIGFCAVTLNANDKGLKLYIKFGFVKTDEYILPNEEEKLNIKDCTPLIFSLITEDAITRIFE